MKKEHFNNIRSNCTTLDSYFQKSLTEVRRRCSLIKEHNFNLRNLTHADELVVHPWQYQSKHITNNWSFKWLAIKPKMKMTSTFSVQSLKRLLSWTDSSTQDPCVPTPDKEQFPCIRLSMHGNWADSRVVRLPVREFSYLPMYQFLTVHRGGTQFCVKPTCCSGSAIAGSPWTSEVRHRHPSPLDLGVRTPFTPVNSVHHAQASAKWCGACPTRSLRRDWPTKG